MKSNHNKWLIISITLLVAAICFVLILLNNLGLFNFDGTESNAKIIASSLVLIGTIFGSIITLIGIFLKHSIDVRNFDLKQQEQNRLELEAKRIENQHEEEEKRLKLEAGIRAIQLLSSDSNTKIPQTQRSGILFTLSNLGMSDLSISMLSQMMSSNEIDAITASKIIGYALDSDNEMIQAAATRIIDNWPEKFLLKNGSMSFPDALSVNWNFSLGRFARRNALTGLLKILMARKKQDWSLGTLNAMIATLCIVWDGEKDTELRNGLGICLQVILQINKDDYFFLDGKELYINKYLEEVKSADLNITSTEFLDFVPLLEEWIKDA